MIRKIDFFFLLVCSLPFSTIAQVPNVKIEYSYALDMYCPQKVEPENLTVPQLKLIQKIPVYRQELLAKMDWIQSQWNIQGVPLLQTTVQLVKKPFPMKDLQAAVFLCPRFPFMGTPLAFNIISYLETPMKDLGIQPSNIFGFISTAFHEVLHKYINDILAKKGSVILKQMNEPELYEAHLHLFALQRLVFTSLGLTHLLPVIQQIEATHGEDYKRAWKAVYATDSKLYQKLLAELIN